MNTMSPFLTAAYLHERKAADYFAYLDTWAEWVMYDMPRTEEDVCMDFFIFGLGGVQGRSSVSVWLMDYGDRNRTELRITCLDGSGMG